MTAVLARLETDLAVLLVTLAGRMTGLLASMKSAAQQSFMERNVRKLFWSARQILCDVEGFPSVTHLPHTLPQLTLRWSIEHRTLGITLLPQAHGFAARWTQGGQKGLS